MSVNGTEETTWLFFSKKSIWSLNNHMFIWIKKKRVIDAKESPGAVRLY